MITKGSLLTIGNDYNENDQKIISSFSRLMGKSPFNCRLLYSSGICYCFIGWEYNEADVTEIQNILKIARDGVKYSLKTP